MIGGPSAPPPKKKQLTVAERTARSKATQLAAARQLFLNQAESACLTLKYIMEDPTNTPRDRIAAASEILDRALGKASQQIDVTSDGEKLDSPLQQMSTEDLLTLASLLQPKVPGDDAVVIDHDAE
jgi:hypothetical protein